MPCQASIDQWRITIMQHLPQFSKRQATVLALWSVGMVLARSCALTAVSAIVAAVAGRKENTLRQRVREWYYEASAKRGAQRQALPVETCFAPLLGWIVSWWQGVVNLIMLILSGGNRETRVGQRRTHSTLKQPSLYP